jgi:hypothetical protein
MIKLIQAQYDSYCKECSRRIDKGDDIYYDTESKFTYHIDCEPSGPESKEHKPFSYKDDGLKGYKK